MTTIDNSHNLWTVRDTYEHINKADVYSIILGYIETDVPDTIEQIDKCDTEPPVFINNKDGVHYINFTWALIWAF